MTNTPAIEVLDLHNAFGDAIAAPGCEFLIEAR